MKIFLVRFLGAALGLATFYSLVLPFGTSVYYLATDPGLTSAAPSRFAFQLHRTLSGEIPSYAERRIASGKAETLDTSQITATEWPVYGAFFYLLATENIQRQWEADPSLASRAPKEYGKQAIEASLELMLDDGHAHWVRLYWGEDHLTDPNCFYRMLRIGCLISHHRLTGKTEHLGQLRELMDDLAADIDHSPHGLIDDYPDQCFPADVVAAIAMVKRAGKALDEDRSEWARRALARVLANGSGGLPSYTADDDTGRDLTPSRGCTNGFFFNFAREIDPVAADRLYQRYAERFWLEGKWCRGWREFPAEFEPDNEESVYYDPDSGPVVTGFGTSATGLGLGAARLHGDHERASQLGAELIVSSWPFPRGRLLVPSLVGDREHAPLFPEIVLLHQLSLSGDDPGERPALPRVVWLIWGIQMLVSLLLLTIAWRWFRWQPKSKT